MRSTMRFTILPVTTVALLTTAFAAGAFAASPTKQALEVIADLESAWVEQDVPRCLEAFAEDADFENSFGWTTRGRESIREFLEWLFARYPKSPDAPQTNVRSQFDVQLLSDRLVLVDAIRETVADTSDLPLRTNRSLYLLKKDGDRWRIWQMRVWEPKRAAATPTDVVAPSRFSADRAHGSPRQR